MGEVEIETSVVIVDKPPWIGAMWARQEPKTESQRLMLQPTGAHAFPSALAPA